MDKKILIILIVAGVVIFVVGGGIGVAYQKQTSGTIQNNTADVKLVNLAKIIKSTPISSIMAFGAVTKISGKTITLLYKKENINIKIRDGAKIFKLVQAKDANGKMTSTQKPAVFGDIKVGDNLNVGVKIASSNTLEGSSVVIFPAPAK
jgi:hypothetical protein